MPTDGLGGGGLFFTRKLMGIPLWVWMAGAVAGLYLWEKHKAGTSSTSTVNDGTASSTSPGNGFADFELQSLADQVGNLATQLQQQGQGVSSSPSPGNGTGPTVSPGNTGNPGIQPVAGQSPIGDLSTGAMIPSGWVVAPNAGAGGTFAPSSIENPSGTPQGGAAVYGPTPGASPGYSSAVDTNGANPVAGFNYTPAHPFVPVSQRTPGATYNPAGQQIG